MRTTVTKSEILNIGMHRAEIIAYCVRNAIRYLGLFGSQLHDDARPDSDTDLLIEFEPGVRVGLFKLSLMELELSEMLSHPVQLRTRDELSSHFRQTVIDEAARIYAHK